MLNFSFNSKASLVFHFQSSGRPRNVYRNIALQPPLHKKGILGRVQATTPTEDLWSASTLCHVGAHSFATGFRIGN